MKIKKDALRHPCPGAVIPAAPGFPLAPKAGCKWSLNYKPRLGTAAPVHRT